MDGVDWAVNYLHSLVSQSRKTFCVKAHLYAQVKGEEEQGLPSDRIMVGGFSQVRKIISTDIKTIKIARQ